MKARIIFYCAAVVALVLILAAAPSHATERRDPLMIQDTQQSQGAKASGSAHGTPGATTARASHKKSSHARASSQSDAKNRSAVKSASGKNADSIQNGTGGGTAAK